MRSSDPLALEVHASLDTLPGDAEALFAANPGLYCSRAWWRTVLAHGIPHGGTPLLLVCRIDRRSVALFPLRRDPGGMLSALATPYTCLYRPLLAPALDRAAQHRVFAAFARWCRGAAAIRLEPFDPDWPALEACIRAARRAGLIPLRFDAFGNWHEAVEGLDWDGYLASRPGALRETVRRRLRRADREARFELVRDGSGLDAGIAAYEQVYARSWKESEPFPQFNPALMRAGAAEGWLRLGLMRIGRQPAAVQFWVLDQGVAGVLKLAHDEAYRALSPGTALTAWMLRHFLQQERIRGIDFGRGDDAYKQGWARDRRQRIGLVLANPARRGSWPLLTRHLAGRVRATLHPKPAAAG
jgi:CelD/BcsL family acetyltransferase involved in cellulose biosynthesis